MFQLGTQNIAMTRADPNKAASSNSVTKSECCTTGTVKIQFLQIEKTMKKEAARLEILNELQQISNSHPKKYHKTHTHTKKKNPQTEKLKPIKQEPKTDTHTHRRKYLW